MAPPTKPMGRALLRFVGRTTDAAVPAKRPETCGGTLPVDLAHHAGYELGAFVRHHLFELVHLFGRRDDVAGVGESAKRIGDECITEDRIGDDARPQGHFTLRLGHVAMMAHVHVRDDGQAGPAAPRLRRITSHTTPTTTAATST